MKALLSYFITIFNDVVLVYFFLLNSVYLLTTFMAFPALRRYAQRLKSLNIEDLLSSSGSPPITVIAPAYNEELTCVESINALLNLEYPDFEILVVNDGSKDATIRRLTEVFDLKPSSRIPLSELSTKQIKGVYRSKKIRNCMSLIKRTVEKQMPLMQVSIFAKSLFLCY